MARISSLSHPVTPSDADSRLARQSSHKLARFLGKKRSHLRVHLQQDNKKEEVIAIPKSALQLLADILEQMARGNSIALVPVDAELTTQQAADLLQVSRPFLVKLIDAGRIPARKVGAHRRIRFDDLVRFKQQNDRARLQALDELSSLDQELGLGY